MQKVTLHPGFSNIWVTTEREDGETFEHKEYIAHRLSRYAKLQDSPHFVTRIEYDDNWGMYPIVTIEKKQEMTK